MADYTQDNRKMWVSTPLGKDVVLLARLRGREEVSRLFRFQLDVIARNGTKVPFDKLLGQGITVGLWLPGDGKRFLNGICCRVSQGGRDDVFTSYRIEIVPQAWFLSLRAQSRIFQHLTVLQILKKVMKGIDVSWEVSGTFHPRDFCVQYRETDLAFASRLMEEEGIFYFFKHADGGHKMVVANTQSSFPDVPGDAKLIYDELYGGKRDEDRIYGLDKTQEIRSGKVTLWDHTFELPHKHLEAESMILDSIPVGKETHRLRVAGNTDLERYDFPGAYAQRFDGIDKGGGERPSELQKIFQDNKRTVEIRMDEETVPGLALEGQSNARQLVSGHRFRLERHFNADDQYLLLSVDWDARQGEYRSGEQGLAITNVFRCIPAALPFRPLRLTPKPVVQGTQTAVVVGPAGEEIFTDKYSRIKVQFHWDREGKRDPDSSCWIRVGTPWAGRQWGMVHIPRIGQEVIVDFLEGDPDQPIVVGSVYNADMMPPYQLPAKKTQSGIKSRSTLGGGPSEFNELRFEDKKGSEQVYLHAQKNEDIVVENDKTEDVGHDETIDIGNDRTETVGHNEVLSVGNSRQRTVGSNESVSVGGSRDHSVASDESISVGGNETVSVGGSRSASVGKSDSVSAGQSISLQAGQFVEVSAGTRITLSVGSNSIEISNEGIKINGIEVEVSGMAEIKESAPKIEISGSKTEIKGQKIKVEGQKVEIKGSPVKINC